MDPSLIASVLEQIPTAWREEFESKRPCFASRIADMRLYFATLPPDNDTKFHLELRCTFENGYVLLIKPGTAGAPEVSISLPPGFPQSAQNIDFYTHVRATWPIHDTDTLVRQLERTSMDAMEEDVVTCSIHSDDDE